MTECVHKQITSVFGSWNTGVEMGDMLLAWWRHTYNQGISERRRLGFPKIGHGSTWLIDKLQVLVEENHGTVPFPTWSAESDYERTPERFGTVPLHSEQLGNAVAKIDDSKLQGMDLTRTEQYLARCTGVECPFLPVTTKEEKALFSRLVGATSQQALDHDSMAIEWCNHVDGKTVFPKLPVYLRTYEATWKKNRAAQSAVGAAAAGRAVVQQVMDKTAHSGAMQQPQQYVPLPAARIVNVCDEGERVIGGIAVQGRAAPPPALAGAAVQVHVGGGRKKRGRPKGSTAPRHCKRCRQFKGPNAGKCRGRTGRHGASGCEYFDALGAPLTRH